MAVGTGRIWRQLALNICQPNNLKGLKTITDKYVYSNMVNNRLMLKWVLEHRDILINKIVLFCNITVKMAFVF